MVKVYNRDKIKSALLKEYAPGSILTNAQIRACVKKYFPDFEEGSLNPCDYCCNHQNEDPYSGKYHIYEKQGRGKYKLL